jgi:hypothetical protein
MCCFPPADSINPLLDTATDILQDSSNWAINNAKTAVDTARVLSQVGGRVSARVKRKGGGLLSWWD